MINCVTMYNMALQKLVVLAVVLTTSMSTPISNYPNFPKTINEYFEQRDALLEAQKVFENRNFTLSEDEIIVDQFFGYLKWREMKRTSDYALPSSRPIEEVLPIIRASELYEHLITFPKGGNLHSHENQQLSHKELFDILWNCKDFEHLYVILPTRGTPESGRTWLLDFFANPPTDENWVKVKDSGISKNELLAKYNLIDTLTDTMSRYPTDTRKRWKLFGKLLSGFSSQVINNIEVKKMYLLAMYKESMNEGVSYIETRRLFSLNSLYTLDFSGASRDTNGKKYLNSNLTFEIDMILDLIKQFKSQYPRFIGHKIILSAYRSKTREDFQKNLDYAIILHKLYPNFVIGFDAANEEDDGYSNLYFIENYLSGKGSIPLYLHSVETSWPDDLLVGSKDDDLLPPLQNAFEVILLQTRRAGHGKGFFKTPYLRKLLKDRNIAVEVCPTSNQVLGYDPDLRNHFGQILYREGIPVVFGSDDQGTFGWYDGMVLDYYAAYVSWGLNLADLKKLALNSLIYSGMADDEKENAIENYWKPSWNKYVQEMKEHACSRNFHSEALMEWRPVKFNQVLPNRGPPGTKVHVFGRNFEVAICKTIRCRFGDIISNAVYVSNQHLLCHVPKCLDSCYGKFPISVSLNGVTFDNTNLTFTYNTQVMMGSARRIHKLHSLIILILIVTALINIS